MLALLFSSRSLSQQVTGNLEGRTLDSLQQPLDAVNVLVAGPAVQGVHGTSSDAFGYFHIFALPPGSYTVNLSRTGYRQAAYENVAIQLGTTTGLGEIRLQPKTQELPEIVVSVERSSIDPVSTRIGGNLNAEEFRDLPLDRNYRTMITLLPQANQSFLGDGANVAGATGLENKFYIDGVDVTDSYIGVSSTDLPYNLSKEIEVKAGGYEAEYRSALGSVVNVITYSGGNDFHGQAFGFFTSDGFTRHPRQGPLDPTPRSFSQYDMGISIGGPLVRDVLWFSAAYNPTYEWKDAEISGAGIFRDKKRSEIFAGKITWRASEKARLVLSIFGDPLKRDGVLAGGLGIVGNPDPFLSDVRGGGINYSLYGNFAPNDVVLLEAYVSTLTRETKKSAATERGRNEIAFINTETGVTSGGFASFADDHRYGTTLDFRGTMNSGTHTFKAGLAYKEVGVAINEETRSLLRFSDTSYSERFIYGRGSVRNRVPSMFVQDSWQVSERLRANVGIRWDGQFLVGSDGKVDQRILTQWQPRVGLIYLPGGSGDQKISASFGRFYQELGMAVSTLYLFSSGGFSNIRYKHDPRVDPSGGTTKIGYNAAIQPEDRDLKGQHFDEFSLGYERLVSANLKAGVRGVYRTLREAIEDCYVSEKHNYFFGNPGRGVLSAFPKARREYGALVFTLEKSRTEHFSFLASYVLSRSYGNYGGLFDGDYHATAPNLGASFEILETLHNATGLLPNNRTHVFKFSGAYHFDFGLTVGGSASWQSGTPLNEFGGTPSEYLGLLRQRGTVGTTPAIWDLNVRFAYDLGLGTLKPRLIVDVFHVGSVQKPVDFDQIHYFSVDENGNQIYPNPTYGAATTFQPPMSVRLGLEVNF
jgi:hypothetical protein